jgi:hypothetical protein
MRLGVLPRAVAIEGVAVGLEIGRQVRRRHRGAGLSRPSLHVIHRPGEQADARRRHRFDERVFADFDRGAVRELNLGAPVLRAQAIARHERHVANRRLAFALALERDDAFDDGEVSGGHVLGVRLEAIREEEQRRADRWQDRSERGAMETRHTGLPEETQG